MSLFGGSVQDVNILGFQKNQTSNISSLNLTDLLLQLFDVIETLEETIVNLFAQDGEFLINPEFGFKNITITAKYSQLLARKVYYKNGFKTRPDGRCDCTILERLYKEHPILRMYSFEDSEPYCCSSCT
jgi:hypothetical protein